MIFAKVETQEQKEELKFPLRNAKISNYEINSLHLSS
jgi:hypothetical protein